MMSNVGAIPSVTDTYDCGNFNYKWRDVYASGVVVAPDGEFDYLTLYYDASIGGNITVTGTVDGRDVATDGTKLDGIATGATNYTDSNVDTHLNVSTATTGEVLSWTGTDYDWIAAGGGFELFAENPSSPTAPSATGANAIAFGSNANASGSSAFAFGTARAQGASSFAVNLGNTGSLYKAGGTNSIAMGPLARAPDNNAIAIGENAQTAAANAIALGSGSEASNAYSIALGGRYARTGADYSMATGYWSRSHVVGSKVHASGRFSSWGDAQTGTYVLRSDTTNATAEAMTADNSTAGTTNQIILPNNSSYFFSGTIIARQDAASGTDVGAWEIKGAIRREANAASTVLVKSTIDDFNVPTGWDVALTADTTNGGLAITVTGAAATNIRWVATVNTSEVTY